MSDVKIVRYGTLTAKVYPFKDGRFRVKYYDQDGKLQIGGTYKDLKKAKNKAFSILKSIDRADVGSLTTDESRVITYMREGSLKLEDIAHLVAERRLRDDMDVLTATNDFIDTVVSKGHYSMYQERDYKKILASLSDVFSDKFVWQITLIDLEKWSDSWVVKAKRYNNKRSLLVKFWGWCCARNYTNVNIPSLMLRQRSVRSKGGHEVWSPKQFAIMLDNCPESYLPWLALSGFCGFRGVEIYGRPEDRSSGLRWENLDWANKRILLDQESAKITKRSKARIVPMCEGLISWLKPWKNKTGIVHPYNEPSKGIKGEQPVTTQIGSLVGGWRKNALRASRASYRMAECKNTTVVTLEMGHTSQVLHGTYLNPRFEEDAELWFGLTREKVEELLADDKVVSM